MKSILFDAGPIISFSTNNLLWLLDDLKTAFNGSFYITPAVKNELVDKPLKTKRFEFEALQVMRLIKNNVIEVKSVPLLQTKKDEVLNLCNNLFQARGNWLRIVHEGEAEILAYAIICSADAIVIDERTTRMIIENPYDLLKILGKKLHTKVTINKANLKKIQEMVKDFRVLRSIELATIAYEKKLIDKFKPDIPNGNKILINSVLWGLKLHGCAVSRREIDIITKMETK